MNSGPTPQRVGPTHRSNQLSHLGRNRRTTSVLATALPRPVSLETFSMPLNDRFRLDDAESVSPTTPNPRQKKPKATVSSGQARPFCSSLKDRNLLTQGKILVGQRSLGRQSRNEGPQQRPNHGPMVTWNQRKFNVCSVDGISRSHNCPVGRSRRWGLGCWVWSGV